MASSTGAGLHQQPLVPRASSTLRDVRRVFAEITRYPEDILEPGADVEEELGIDSVKLGEILAALRERYQLPPTSELRARFPAKQLRTIGGISEAVAAIVDSSAAVESSAAAAVARTAPLEREVPVTYPIPASSSTSLFDDVRQIFADLTRYPLDILSADADLEEELGIDSVKLGEIFSVLRERYALPPRADLRERISPEQLRTIAAITGIVRRFGNTNEAAPLAETPVAAHMTEATASSEPEPAVAAPVEADFSPSAEPTAPGPEGGISGLAYLTRMIAGDFPAPPIAHLLDFTLREISPGRALLELHPAANQYNVIGVVHGGVASTVLDSAMACALQALLPAGADYVTLELNVNFVRPVRSDVGPLLCEGKVVHADGSVATTEARLTDASGRLYAHATGSCLIRQAPSLELRKNHPTPRQR